MVDFKNKTVWITLGVILVAPIILNLTIFQFRTPFTYEGDWLSFWGNYSGGLISAFIAYFVANLQIQKQVKLDLAKERYYRTVNQLPALVRIKIELEKYIEELTRVMEEREATIKRSGGIAKKPDEYDTPEEFFTSDTIGIKESELTEKHYDIELADTEVSRYLEQVENIDLQVDLITLLNFYKDFSVALLFNHEIADRKINEEAGKRIKDRATRASEVFVNLNREANFMYLKKRSGWEKFYEKDILQQLKDTLMKLKTDIEEVKEMKKNEELKLKGKLF